MLDRLRKPSTAQVLQRGLRRVVPKWVPVRRVGRLVGFVAVVLIGAWLGLMIGGRETTSVGPVNTHMSAGVSWSGDTLIRVGPLGTLTLDTHDGPIGVTVTVDQLNVADARALFEDPAALAGLESWIAADAREAIRRLVIRSAASAVIGAVVLSVLVYRRRTRRVALVGITAAAVVVGTVGAAAASWNPRAVAEPEYSGLLVNAPSVVGNAQDIVASFTDYSQGLAKLVGNVSKLYDVTSTLPAYEPEDSSMIRVLHVADIHLNPAAWDVIASISQQFNVALIIDAGDISDHGTKAERRFVDAIAGLSIPYVYVRGNHDSQAIADAVAAQPNAIVLDKGESREVAGLRIAGEADPRFTPDKSEIVMSNEQLTFLGRNLAWRLLREPKPDVAVVHDPTVGYPLDGTVPLVLAGHTHTRATKLLEHGTRIFVQGSTGGAGLRALEGAQPTPIEMSVLYFDATTKRLQAWDDITIGGLGLTSAQINRTIAPEQAEEFKRKAAEQEADPFQGP